MVLLVKVEKAEGRVNVHFVMLLGYPVGWQFRPIEEKVGWDVVELESILLLTDWITGNQPGPVVFMC